MQTTFRRPVWRVAPRWWGGIVLAALLSISGGSVAAGALGPSPGSRLQADHPTAGQEARPADCPLHPAGGEATRSPLEEAGDAAFGALAETVSALDDSDDTDWGRVDLDALREHLVDMARVTLRSRVEKIPLSDGFEATVRGDDERTVGAIRRMVPAHSRMMRGHRGWQIDVSEVAGGVRVTVRATGDESTAESEVKRLQGLGFFGFLASGDHHRRHHWQMATGGGHPN